MRLTREEMLGALDRWQEAWDRHDLDGVMTLFHEDVLFENYTGARVMGREMLREAWAPWFQDHGGFRFTVEDSFADTASQKALVRWTLDWPSREECYEGEHETRRGVDVILFEGGEIVEKLTYSKTTAEIGGVRVVFVPRVVSQG